MKVSHQSAQTEPLDKGVQVYSNVVLFYFS